MIISYNNSHLYDEELEPLLLKFYTADTLWQACQASSYLQKLVPDLKKRPKKSMVTKLFVGMRPAEVEAFIASFPQDTYTAFSALLWERSIRYDKFKEKTGVVFEWMEDLGNRHFYDKKKSNGDGLSALIVFHPEINHYAHETDVANSQVSLPPSVRSWLKPYFPKPEGYNIQALAEEPKVTKTRFLFSDPTQSLQTIASTADFLTRSKIKMLASGEPAKSSIREIQKAVSPKEFYTKSSGLGDLRTRLLIHTLRATDRKKLSKFTAGNTDAGDFINELVTNFLGQSKKYIPSLLPYLGLKEWEIFGTLQDNEDLLLEGLRLALTNCPSNSWISFESIKRFLLLRDQKIITYPLNLEAKVLNKDNAYLRNTPIDARNDFELLRDPLLAGALFTLAAIGALEIFYEEPKNETYLYRRNPFLTELEGVLAVRLTPMGEFIFGLREDLGFEFSGIERGGIDFHPSRLHVHATGIDPITQSALDNYLEKLGEQHFRLTRSSLIGKANTQKEIKARVDNFKKELRETLPKHWVDFIQKILDEKPVLRESNTCFQVFEIADDAMIRNAFLKDPILKKLSAKAEGWRILVENKDLAKLKARLRALGFICE